MQSQFGCHLTCFVGIIDLQERALYYILAGHLPRPVLIEEGRAVYLEGVGKPVGIFPDIDWKVYRRPLADQFSLVVFSDGILDVLPAGDLLGREAYLLALVQSSDGTLDDISNRLRLSEFESAPDDIAILTLTQRGRL